ncbi:unnamed protein product [Vitrella brassicaformis CCMP3155]|uniref:Uncharacterized protein n=1 Tax=Vitrella brassicaformis (strain CCMP3155) TaxID=1169540 RepID=A0A0G4GBE3_VITBC|nr:unnamed protein product [Vitrella brassicaformis CCMP3155]|eukprot:CEM26442.1 unnamed protein product [Vitrella brassicaformis CCMP3155]
MLTKVCAHARCNQGKTTGAITREREKLKKDHHLDVCRLNRMDFTAFIVTCDGVYGREADGFIRRLAELINQRGGWDKHGTGRVEQWIRARLSVCLARSVLRVCGGPGGRAGGIGCIRGGVGGMRPGSSCLGSLSFSEGAPL